MQYRPEVDGLRALAVVPVVLFHAGLSAFSGGFVGVDVFFVISGFLITTILLNEHEQGKFSIVNFYERRARRILPALFVVMLACLPFAWFWLLPNDLANFSESLIAVSVFASNILFWQETGYFDTASELKPLLHTWSLAVEEQYYVLFPLFITLVWRFGKKILFGAMIVMAVVSLVLAEWASLAKPAAAFFLLPTRGWELLLGACCAMLMAYRPQLRPGQTSRDLLAWAGIAAIAGAVVLYDETTPFPGIYALLPTVGTALIILFADAGTTAGRFLANRVFVGIGLVSYSAYLWHQPLFAFARHRSPIEPSVAVFAALIAATFVLAYLSWRFVEAPFRDRRRIDRKTIFGLSIAGAAGFSVLGAVGTLQDGFPQRLERAYAGDIGQLEFHQYIDERYQDCEPPAIAAVALTWEGYLRCKQSQPGLPDIVLLGDSHAEHLFIGLAEGRPDDNVGFYILNGAPYASNSDYAAILDHLLNNGRPQQVLLTMFYEGRLDPAGTGLEQGFGETIAALQKAGKTVTLIGDVPGFPQDAARCAYKTFEAFTALCRIDRDEVERQKAKYAATLERLGQRYGVPVITTDPAICSPAGCAMHRGKTLIYRDQNHLNITGSRLVGRYVADRLAR